MRRRALGVMLLAGTLAAGGCVDYEAGAEILSGKAALLVGLDLVGRGLPGAPSTAAIAVSRAATATATTATFDSLNMQVGGLPQLRSGAEYQVWLVNATTQETFRAPARIQFQRPDTTGIDPFTEEPLIVWRLEGPRETKTAFDGVAGWRQMITLKNADVIAAGANMLNFTHIVITIGEGADADPYTSTAPAWLRYQVPGLTTVATRFPTGGAVRAFFNPEPGYIDLGWGPLGGGSVEFLHMVGFGLSVRRIARPPLGFFYDVWLINERGARPPLRVGPLSSLAPEFRSLVDADLNIIPDLVSQREVLRAGYWSEWSWLGIPFEPACTDPVTVQPCGRTSPSDFYTNVVVVLRSKDQLDALPNGTVQRPPGIVYSASIPFRLDHMPVEKERTIRDKDIDQGRRF